MDELGHESGHVNLGNGYYASRSSAGRVTIGSKCPRSFGSEPNYPRYLKAARCRQNRLKTTLIESLLYSLFCVFRSLLQI